MNEYEHVIINESAKWFPDCEDLLIWAWDDERRDLSNRCTPLDVVDAWNNKIPFPPQVRRVGDDFLRLRMEREWELSELDSATIPHLFMREDATGRRAWRVDLSECSEEIRLAVGRTTMRGDDLPAWDYDWENLAYPEFSKTCVISSDDGRYLYEPTTADIMSLIDELRPEPETPAYFMLMYRNLSYIQVWMHPEGVFTEIRFWQDIVTRKFTHWRASTTEIPIPSHYVGETKIAEENLLPLSIVTKLVMDFHLNPSILPTHAGVHWIIDDEKT